MTIKLFNTLSRAKEEFVPLDPPRVTFYNCGPTVYDVFHVGNARNFVFADMLRRYLAYSGYEVEFVQNLTDVDDKIINRANEEGKTPEQVATENTERYFHYADALNVKRAAAHPKATENIDGMIAMIERLIERGHAYPVGGDVYFDIMSYPKRGQLKKQDIDEMQQGERVDAALVAQKKSPADFTLWKAAKEGEPAWDSPWGPGRPGWHIECSVMSIKHLGETIDIHSGGADLAFPHHENEIAQSTCSTGKQFVRYWVHNGFITFSEEEKEKAAAESSEGSDEGAFGEQAAKEKISKSTMTSEQRSLFMIDRALERFGARALRFFLVGAHYRSPLAFSIKLVEQAGARASKIGRLLRLADTFMEKHQDLAAASAAEPNKALADEFTAKFRDAMDDDLNSAEGLAVLSEALAKLNWLRIFHDKSALGGGSDAKKSANLSEMIELRRAIGEMLDIFGMTELLEEKRSDVEGEASIDGAVEALIATRAAARTAKDFTTSDAIRDRLAETSIVLEDGAEGTTFRVADDAPSPPLDDIMELAIALRAELRAAKSFELADALRDALTKASITLEDHPDGTTWAHAEE